MSDDDAELKREIECLLGIGPESARFSENLEAFRDILVEIRKLRRLDLRDIHPAIVFDPMLPYRK